VAESVGDRDSIVPLLPSRPEGGAMEMAHQIVAALTAKRSDAWAAYLVRW
jgi:hypothetical protein